MPEHLTMWQTVLQSQLIHPDWDVATHLAYLRQEGHDPILLNGPADEVVARWLRENRRNYVEVRRREAEVAGLPVTDEDRRLLATDRPVARAWPPGDYGCSRCGYEVTLTTGLPAVTVLCPCGAPMREAR